MSKNMDLTIKEIGDLGENLTKKYLEDENLYVEKGFGKDLRVYRTEPSNTHSKVTNYFTCEVKTSMVNEVVHRPHGNQGEANELLAQVRLRDVFFNRVRFEIRFEKLGEGSDFLEDKIPFDWEEVSYRK